MPSAISQSSRCWAAVAAAPLRRICSVRSRSLSSREAWPIAASSLETSSGKVMADAAAVLDLRGSPTLEMSGPPQQKRSSASAAPPPPRLGEEAARSSLSWRAVLHRGIMAARISSRQHSSNDCGSQVQADGCTRKPCNKVTATTSKWRHAWKNSSQRRKTKSKLPSSTIRCKRSPWGSTGPNFFASSLASSSCRASSSGRASAVDGKAATAKTRSRSAGRIEEASACFSSCPSAANSSSSAVKTRRIRPPKLKR
mmetsp:Transcript_136951/g.346950  ORF Transcript_136951/g.346950 Transcript_136951/m.346950 type:complete len:255 (+) Transcript_136951:129-893(+)